MITKARTSRNPLTWLASLVEWVGMIAVITMMLHIIAEIVMRGLLNHPIPGTLEYVTYYYMLLVSFVGMFLGQKRREHVSVTMITDRLGLRGRLIVVVAGNLLTAAILVLFIWWGAVGALHQMSIGEVQGAGASMIIIWPSRFIVPITLFMFLFTLVAQTVEHIRNPETLEEDDEIQEVELI